MNYKEKNPTWSHQSLGLGLGLAVRQGVLA